MLLAARRVSIDAMDFNKHSSIARSAKRCKGKHRLTTADKLSHNPVHGQMFFGRSIKLWVPKYNASKTAFKRMKPYYQLTDIFSI